MEDFRVTGPAKLKVILETFASLDEARWRSKPGRTLVNFCQDGLSSGEKLLVHWLAYITDRRTPFRRIWELGGYVLSHLVRAYVSASATNVRDVFDNYLRKADGRFLLECQLEEPNQRLERYGVYEGPVQFASRYMPEDAALIFRTLAVLDSVAGRSMGRFVGQTVEPGLAFDEAILSVARGLDELTYCVGGALSTSELERRLQKEVVRAAEFHLGAAHEIPHFRRKRLWAALRDYLKRPELNTYFVDALREAEVPGADRWDGSNPELVGALHVLELPGDVWNNAETFRTGLFSPYLIGERKSWDMPRTIREVYDRLAAEDEIGFYPEQLDVTFDFVPRMCEQQMCRACPFGAGVAQLCHEDREVWCPVVLSCCGYTVRCEPNSCTLRDDAVLGLCQNAL
ncbi:MAG: hypothetical protein R6X33_09835 [Candidatus Brocadiia bacterium]